MPSRWRVLRGPRPKSEQWPHAKENGAVLTRASVDKEAKFAELVGGNRCVLVVVALETCGRWSGEVVEFIDMMAGEARAREVLPIMQRSGVATPLDAHVECVLCSGIRQLLGGSWSEHVEWHWTDLLGEA